MTPACLHRNLAQHLRGQGTRLNLRGVTVVHQRGERGQGKNSQPLTGSIKMLSNGVQVADPPSLLGG